MQELSLRRQGAGIDDFAWSRRGDIVDLFPVRAELRSRRGDIVGHKPVQEGNPVFPFQMDEPAVWQSDIKCF